MILIVLKYRKIILKNKDKCKKDKLDKDMQIFKEKINCTGDLNEKIK
jgi:hypothetical protein